MQDCMTRLSATVILRRKVTFNTHLNQIDLYLFPRSSTFYKIYCDTYEVSYLYKTSSTVSKSSEALFCFLFWKVQQLLEKGDEKRLNLSGPPEHSFTPTVSFSLRGDFYQLTYF